MTKSPNEVTNSYPSQDLARILEQAVQQAALSSQAVRPRENADGAPSPRQFSRNDLLGILDAALKISREIFPMDDKDTEGASRKEDES
jgi:hypothetical protein